MRTLIIFICIVIFCPIARANLYFYPENKRPAVSLKDACAIGEVILGKLGLEKDAYVYGVTIFGDEGQTGAGAWNLDYRNEQGDKIRISISFPEDYCYVMLTPKAGGYSEKGFTREGLISPKWIKWEEEVKKAKNEAENENEDVFDKTVPKK